eukprot:2224415-Rhodomonas_salina.4
MSTELTLALSATSSAAVPACPCSAAKCRATLSPSQSGFPAPTCSFHKQPTAPTRPPSHSKRIKLAKLTCCRWSRHQAQHSTAPCFMCWKQVSGTQCQVPSS